MWKIAKVFGINIYIHYTLFIMIPMFVLNGMFDKYIADNSMFFLLSYLYSFCFAVLLYFSVLLHEFTHSLVAIRYGYSIKKITVFALGGVASIEEKTKKPGHEFIISVVGPLSSLLVALSFFVLSYLIDFLFQEPGIWGLTESLFIYMVVINIVLAVFNILPTYPMDGGRVLKSIIWKITGKEFKALKISVIICPIVFSVALSVYYLVYNSIPWFVVIIAVLIFLSGFNEYKTFKEKKEGE